MSRAIGFLVEEAPGGGYTARSLRQAIFTEGDTPEELETNARDAVVVSDVDGVTYSGSGTTDGTGVFTLAVNGIPAGGGKLMLYYFGPNLAPSTIGPLSIKF